MDQHDIDQKIFWHYAEPIVDRFVSSVLGFVLGAAFAYWWWVL